MIKRHEFLRGIHRVCRPRTYLEIGINDGRSLALSRARTIAIDPAFKITKEVSCDLQLVKATSDDFFARDDALAHFPERTFDLGFIDGMHLFEFALRDFINLERHATWTSVIVLDDVLPRSVDEAARDRHTGGWTGDVYKMWVVLSIFRPDLTLFALDTRPTGVLLVLGADPANTTLRDRYDEIVTTYLRPDPQQVPEDVLKRRIATDPGSMMQAGFWSRLVEARAEGAHRVPHYADLRRAAEAAAVPAPEQDLASLAEAAHKDSAHTVRPVPRPLRSRSGRRRLYHSLRRRLRPLRRRARTLRS